MGTDIEGSIFTVFVTFRVPSCQTWSGILPAQVLGLEGVFSPRRRTSAGFRLMAGMTDAENIPAKEIPASSTMLLARPGRWN